MASGPLLGGWIYDARGSYGWLYLTSFGMGLGAALIALTFEPFAHAGSSGIIQTERPIAGN